MYKHFFSELSPYQLRGQLQRLLRTGLISGVALLVSSCSLLGNTTVESVTLPANPSLEQISFEQISSSPNLYRKRGTSINGEYSVYMTAIKQCEVAEALSSIATTRQLLVGLRDIKVERQESTHLAGNRALLSVLDATLDGVPLKIALYTLRDQDCVTDYVIWLSEQDKKSLKALFERELPTFTPFLMSIVPEKSSSLRARHKDFTHALGSAPVAVAQKRQR